MARAATWRRSPGWRRASPALAATRMRRRPKATSGPDGRRPVGKPAGRGAPRAQGSATLMMHRVITSVEDDAAASKVPDEVEHPWLRHPRKLIQDHSQPFRPVFEA